MGCVHTKVGPTRLKPPIKKASTKVAKQVKSHDPSACLMCKKLGHHTKNCSSYKEARKRAQVTTRRWYGCNEMGHMVDGCPNKQSKHRANQGRICYACRRKGHLSYDCPNGEIPKPNTFVYDYMLRKATNGVSTSKVISSLQTSDKAIWVLLMVVNNRHKPSI